MSDFGDEMIAEAIDSLNKNLDRIATSLEVFVQAKGYVRCDHCKQYFDEDKNIVYKGLPSLPVVVCPHCKEVVQ